MNINEWVRAARKHADLTQEALGEKMGLTKGNISGWEKGRHNPSFNQLLTIEELTNYPLIDAANEQDKTQASTLSPILSWEHEDDLPQGEYVFIPRLDIHLSAGNGRDQIEFEFVKRQPQAFRADWIREEGLKPNKLACMKVDGDSMESLLYHGDTVVVDTSQTGVVDSKVYALWYDGGERIKRLWKLPGGGLRIKSDNSQHPTIDVLASDVENVRIIGRIVNKGGKGGL